MRCVSKLVATLLLIATIAGCSSAGHSPLLTINQPTNAELTRFLPGGISSTNVPREAPLPCGGVAKSVRTGAAAIRVPDSLLALSVARYRFPDTSSVNAYVHEVTTISSQATGGACKVPGPFPGATYSSPIGYLTNDGYYMLTAPIKLGPGIYQGSYLYITIAYVVQGDEVSVVRVDRQAGYANEAFMGSLLTALEPSGGPTLNTGSHSAHPSTTTAVLRRADYLDIVGGANPAVSGALCPQAVIGGVPYNITFERQLPHTTPLGVVVPGSKAGTSTIIRWGSRATLSVDLFDTVTGEPGDGCVSGTGSKAITPGWVRVISMKP